MHGKETFQITVSSVYETSPNSFQSYEIAALPYVLYKSCKYSVPDAYAFKTVSYKIVSGKSHIYDEAYNFICSHYLSDRKGSINQLDGQQTTGADGLDRCHGAPMQTLELL